MVGRVRRVTEQLNQSSLRPTLEYWPLQLSGLDATCPTCMRLERLNDVPTFQRCVFHPSLETLLYNASIVNLVSASTHSSLLVSFPDGSQGRQNNILLGAGTNTLGQLGPRCALWDEVKPETRFKAVDLLGPLDLSYSEWEPVRIASTWTTSFVVYQRILSSKSGGSSSAAGGEREKKVEQIVLASGSNDFGELGVPRTNGMDGLPVSKPSTKPTIVDLGLKEGEWVDIIKGGQRHVIAVICWGSGKNGEQRMVGWGAARKGELDSFTLAGKALSESRGSTKGKGKGKGKSIAQTSTVPPIEVDLPVPSNACIVDIALGASHNVALLSNGELLAWGNSSKGQISGLGEERSVNGVAASWNTSYFLRDGEVFSQGHNTALPGLGSHEKVARKQVELPMGWQTTKLVAGSEHVVVVASSEGEEEVWVEGWNEHGNLGLGDQLDRDSLTRINIRNAARMARIEGEVSVKGVWGGCAATWVCIDAAS